MFTWTDDNTNQAITLAEQGKSGSEIASALGTTKNSVISKMSRLGHPLSHVQPQKKPKRQVRSRKEAGEKANITRKVNRKIEELQRLSAELKRADAQAVQPSTVPTERKGGASRTVALLDLQPHHCRWPYGNPLDPDFGFCGAKRASGSSYCPEHRVKSTGGKPAVRLPSVLRRRKAA